MNESIDKKNSLIEMDQITLGISLDDCKTIKQIDATVCDAINEFVEQTMAQKLYMENTIELHEGAEKYAAMSKHFQDAADDYSQIASILALAKNRYVELSFN